MITKYHQRKYKSRTKNKMLQYYKDFKIKSMDKCILYNYTCMKMGLQTTITSELKLSYLHIEAVRLSCSSAHIISFQVDTRLGKQSTLSFEGHISDFPSGHLVKERVGHSW